MIEIGGLAKRYGDKTAVDQLSFVVEPDADAHGASGLSSGRRQTRHHEARCGGRRS